MLALGREKDTVGGVVRAYKLYRQPKNTFWPWISFKGNPCIGLDPL
jgi:hypothetical protein